MKKVISIFVIILYLIFITAPALASSDVAFNQPVTASGSIGGTIALSGYLSASGIHLSAQGAAFSDVELELGNLWDLYRSAYQGVKNITDYTGSIVRGGYVLARDAWNAFGGFARWLQNKFNLSDNQDNVSLTDTPTDTALLSATSKTKVGNGRISWDSSNTDFTNGYIQLAGINSTSLYGFYQGPSTYHEYTVCIYNAGNEVVNLAGASVKLYVNGITYNVGPSYATINPGRSAATRLRINTNFNTAFVKTTGTTITPPEPVEPSILSVDTSVIDIPDDISDTATGSDSLGGVMIPAIGAGVGGAVGAIAGTIISGITGGSLIDDVIVTADVELPPGLDIGESGEIFPDVLDIDPSDIFLETDGQILGDLFDYFPFCIPTTIYNVLLGLDSEPVTPVLTYVIPLSSDNDFEIQIDLSPFDTVASILRAGMYLVFCVGWLRFLYSRLG